MAPPANVMDPLSLAVDLVRCYVHPRWDFDTIAMEFRVIWRPMWSRQPLVMPLRSEVHPRLRNPS